MTAPPEKRADVTRLPGVARLGRAQVVLLQKSFGIARRTRMEDKFRQRDTRGTRENSRNPREK
jgi:hypothetical protein